MTISSDLSTIVHPLILQFQPNTVLIAGEVAANACKNMQDTRSLVLTTPFSIEQLHHAQAVDLAIVSNVTETLSKHEATQWLGMLRNRLTQHVIVIADAAIAERQGWQLSDYLALGLKSVVTVNNYQIFSYAIESYQPKREWLNSRFWANPENYDKYRW